MPAANQTFFPRFLLHPDSGLQQAPWVNSEESAHKKRGARPLLEECLGGRRKGDRKTQEVSVFVTTWWSRSQRGLVQVVKV